MQTTLPQLRTEQDNDEPPLTYSHAEGPVSSVAPHHVLGKLRARGTETLCTQVHGSTLVSREGLLVIKSRLVTPC